MEPIPASGAAQASSLYRRVWRWHFFAGLLCLPFIFLLALTGAIYLFNGQIDDVVPRGSLRDTTARLLRHMQGQRPQLEHAELS